MRGLFCAALVVSMMLLGIGFGTTVSAQSPTPLMQEKSNAAGDVETLVERARQDGYRIILVPPEDAAAAANAAPASTGNLISITARIESQGRVAKARLIEILSDINAFPDHVADVVAARAEGGTLWWPVLALGLAALFLLIGMVPGRALEVWMAAKFASLYSENPESRSEQIGYLLIRVLLRGFAVLVQVGVAGLLTLGFGPETAGWRTTMVLTLLCFGIARLMLVLMQGLLAPDAQSHRLPVLSDADAAGLYRGFAIATWLAASVGGICILMDLMVIDREAHLLMLISSMLLAASLFSYLAIRYREAVGRAILGRSPERRGPGFRLLARVWHGIAVVYLLGAWMTTAVRLLIDAPNALSLILAPLLYGIAALSIYAVALLVIDRVFLRRASVMMLAAEGDASTDKAPVRRYGMRELAERAVGLFLVAAYALLVFEAWFPVSEGDDRLFDTGVLEIVLIGFLAHLAFEAVKIVIDDRIASEAGPETEEVESGSEGGGAGASRLATLLPIFRNFLLAVIVGIAFMVILSQLGIDIAPLFAGAGVVGLAVGFGAQTLIRDIFSGAFFLMDDAFRRGEYIEVGGTRGTVERISIRSMQLRHHLGPLHTIPFGEIASLTNYSRDWVMMKLPLRLTYDTDPEVVRKLVKQLGKELMDHPEIGGKFMEPLKSQGVYQMEDSAMIFRVKFMTKPGDQFPVRKIVYARLRELFEQNGIRFAHKEVTVRIAEHPDRALSTEEKDATVGAVRPLIDAEAQAQSDGFSEAR